jgi:hypothetical protein
MRRCPQCQYPNPETALFCQHCGQGLPPVARQPFWRLTDWWWPPALKAALGPLALLLSFRYSFGSWLTVGLLRVEWHFAAFHAMHGALFGFALARARREHQGSLLWRWVLLGLAGGFLAEGLEYWYVYRHVMDSVAFDVMDWFRFSNPTLFPYQLLQVMRFAAPALALWIAWLWTARPSLGQQMAALGWLLLAIYLRAHVMGFALSWRGLGTWIGWQNTAFYAFSALALLYAWGSRPERSGRA